MIVPSVKNQLTIFEFEELHWNYSNAQQWPSGIETGYYNQKYDIWKYVWVPNYNSRLWYPQKVSYLFRNKTYQDVDMLICIINTDSEPNIV